MRRIAPNMASLWLQVGPRFLPFADAASAALPLGRLLRLALFQVSVGMAVVLLSGTLNRVMIVELEVPASLVALMIALPLVFAPFRALIGFRSDTHRSALGWRRVPYIWMGTLLQFGGFAIMPFALLVLSGQGQGPIWVGQVGAALAFLLVGAGLHTTQTAGLALASDLAPAESRPRVVALLYVMLLIGMVGSALLFGGLLATYSPLRLVQVIQGAAVVTVGLNIIALWKQEARRPNKQTRDETRPVFRATWREYVQRPGSRRFLIAVGLGTAGFSMQDILLEPYGAEVLGLSVSATTVLTAFLAGGALAAFGLAARTLRSGGDPCRLAALGAVIGLFAFAAVMLAAPLESAMLFRGGSMLIGFGGGLFAIGTLTVAMELEPAGHSGLALGAWGAVQATAAGVGVGLGGLVRDGASALAATGALGSALNSPATGYSIAYQIETLLLFAALVAIGPLVRTAHVLRSRSSSRFGLAQFPG